MSESLAKSGASWRDLKNEWNHTQEVWCDDTTEFFIAEFWEIIETETKTYLQALESLTEILREAQQVAER